MTDILAGKPDPNDFFITVERWDWDQRFDVSAYLNARDVWLEKLKVDHDLLKEHSGRWLHFVAVDYPEIKESMSPQKLMELKEKAILYEATHPTERHIFFTERHVLIGFQAVREGWKEKAEKLDAQTELIESLSSDIDMLRDKLEAVKTHRENFRHSSYIEWLRELDKILEVEA